MITFALLFYLCVLAFLFFGQRKLQYLPMGQLQGIPQEFNDIYLTTEDGIKILAWFKEPKKGEKIIVYFHGNAGNISNRASKFEEFAKEGFGVMAISYQGYAGSEGKPSESGLINDGKAALDFLLDAGYLPKDFVLFGESLGSGVAVQLAAKFDVAAVILESPYTSITAVAKKTYWFVPVDLILKDKFDSTKYITKISSPILVFHGTADAIVPFSEGKKLYELITAPKKFIEVQGAGHLDFPVEFLTGQLRQFLKEKVENNLK